MLALGGISIGTIENRLTRPRGRTQESFCVPLKAYRQRTVRVAESAGLLHLKEEPPSGRNGLLRKSPPIQSESNFAMTVTDSECGRRREGAGTFVQISLVRLLKAGYTA
jgi:hypothetical protein